MMKNYYQELIGAMHSFFWYEGLLEQYGDEWVNFDKDGNEIGEIYKSESEYGFSRPKYKMNDAIHRLINDLRTKKTEYDVFTISDAKCIFEDEIHHRYSMLWQMMVEMFGECGTSPRTGWITERTECANFLETIVRYEELLHANKLN